MHTNFFLLLLFLILHENISNALLRKFRTFLMGGKKPKSTSWEFAAESEVEYPGNNSEKIRIIQEMWNAYYNCLTTHYGDLGPYKSIMPEAIMAYEGTSVKLKCKACIPPYDMDRTDDVQWNYRTIPPHDTKIVELGEHKFISPNDKTLHMYDLTTDDTGQYFCQRGLSVTSVYFLEVVNSSEPTLEVQPEESPEGPYPQAPQTLPEIAIDISTSWSPWSKCSKCGEVGKKVRYGICMVQLHKRRNLTKNSNNSTIQEEQINKIHNSTKNIITIKPNVTSKRTINQDGLNKNNYFQNIQSDLSHIQHPIFNLFSNGIPCRSKLLPKSLRIVPEVQTRKSEVSIGLCKELCTGSEVFEVLDEKGNVLESANNSAGIYSTLQGIPKEPPEVQRRTIYADTLTKRIALKCPGNLNSDSLIQWQIGSFNIDSVIVYVLSRGRIIINVLDQIIIQKPQVIDSNIYSCWQNGELAGTIRLIVTKKMELNFNQQIMMLGMILILGTFVLVFFRAFRGRNRPQ